MILLPQRSFAAIERGGRDSVRTQVHAQLSHALPGSPGSAFAQVSGNARNLETRLAGTGLVGDNLGSALDQARQDAIYAQLLFLFLGVPGALLAGLVTAAIAAAGADRRRRDAALLRTRGATIGRLTGLALAETALAGTVGAAAGIAGRAADRPRDLRQRPFGASTLTAALWAGGAVAGGFAIAAAAIALPAWRDGRALTVAGQRRQIGRRERAPLWARWYVDLFALAGAALVSWQASRNGYQLVLAPEGVPQVSVNWYALLAPLLAWVGGGLLALRLARLALGRGGRPLSAVLRPLGAARADGRRDDEPPAAAARARRRARRADGRLRRLDGDLQLHLQAAGGGRRAPHQRRRRDRHRVAGRARRTCRRGQTAAGRRRPPRRAAAAPLAYVGADLQDLYGVRPQTIGAAGELQNAWFQGGSAAQLMRTLASRPDAALLSAETVHDFQLRPGDTVRLRLQDGAQRQIPPGPVPLRRRREGVPDRAERLVHRRQRRLRRAADRQRRRRRAARADRRHRPGDGRGSGPRRGRHQRAGDRHRRLASRRRLEPRPPSSCRGRRRSSWRSRSRSRSPRRDSRSGSASTSAGGRSRSPPRSAPDAASWAASSGASWPSRRSAGCCSARRSPRRSRCCW